MQPLWNPELCSEDDASVSPSAEFPDQSTYSISGHSIHTCAEQPPCPSDWPEWCMIRDWNRWLYYKRWDW